jgi:hypothetical protein
MMIPAQYEQFFEEFQDDLPNLARARGRLDLRDRFVNTTTLPNPQERRHTLSLRHPAATLLWAFHYDPNDRRRKTFGIDLPRGRLHRALPTMATAFRRARLGGHSDNRHPDWWRYWVEWGYGQKPANYDRLIHDHRLIQRMRVWGFDAMCVALDVIERRHP